MSRVEDLVTMLSRQASARLLAMLKQGLLTRIDADIVRAHVDGIRIAGGLGTVEAERIIETTRRLVVEESAR
ncbi:MAG: hypothetical protein HXY30_17290 [Pseudorhodoplanes sp.]|nr:hypothetical protein [Pseudorhodoplanes sp.]